MLWAVRTLESSTEREAETAPSSKSLPGTKAYLVFFLGVFATLLRWLLDPWLAGQSPFSPYYFVVAVAAIIGGLRTAVITALVCGIAADYFWVEPRFSLEFLNTGQVVQLLVFFGEAILISMAVSWVRFLDRSCDVR